MIMKNTKQHKGKVKFCLTVDGKTLPYESKEEFLLAVWARLTEMKDRRSGGNNSGSKAPCA